jgi:hypothetical protein
MASGRYAFKVGSIIEVYRARPRSVVKENAWICFTISPTTSTIPSTSMISALGSVMLSSLANRLCRDVVEMLSSHMIIREINW